MFGYIRPQKSELLVREFDEYGGVYCALCRRLGKDYGVSSRLFLNYDCTFYALMLLAFSEAKDPGLSRGRCVANPLKKCYFSIGGEKALAEASALTVILAYYKAADDVADSGFFRGLLYRFVLLFLHFPHRKAARQYPELERIAADAMNGQRRAESARDPGLDRCAEPTARMLEQLLVRAAGEAAESPRARVLRETGYYLGRWVYLMDAADDLKKDLTRGSFNPFAARSGLTAGSTPEELTKARDFSNAVLNETLVRLSAAADLLNFGCLGPLIRNILSLGLPLMQRQCLYRKEDGNGKSL